jgi:branched-chain amino acid transport system permease protein
MLVMVVLGGLGSTTGALIAAVIMTFRNDIVDTMASLGVLDIPGALLPGREQSSETLRGALYGSALIVTVIFMPRGAAGFIEEVRSGGLIRAAQALRRRLPRRMQLRTSAPG